MNRKLMELAEKYVAQRKRRIRLLKTVTALALVRQRDGAVAQRAVGDVRLIKQFAIDVG